MCIDRRCLSKGTHNNNNTQLSCWHFEKNHLAVSKKNSGEKKMCVVEIQPQRIITVTGSSNSKTEPNSTGAREKEVRDRKGWQPHNPGCVLSEV